MAEDTKTSSETVTVCCKLPHGLVLHTGTMQPVFEPVMGGGVRETTKEVKDPETFVVMGNSFPEGGAPRGRMEFGYAMTPGCPKKLWDRWLAAHKDLPAVTNGLIFAHAKDANAVAEAREMEKVRSGFERLDPTKPPKGVEVIKASA